jgi:predicted glycosyltransferase
MAVWVSFEGEVPPGLERHACPAVKSRIHDLLWHAAVVVGDSGSIPAEAALLGTPSLRFTSRPRERDMGGFKELESAGLLETFHDVEALSRRADAFPLPQADREARRASAAAYLRALDDPLSALANAIEQVGPGPARATTPG